MSHKDNDRRVRVITDKVKYRRHQRKKILRKLGKLIVWAFIAIAAMVIIWAVLNMMFRPQPIE